MLTTHAGHVLDYPQALAWSPDSMEITCLGSLKIRILNLQGDVVQEIDITGLVNAQDVWYHPRDKNILFLKARTNALGMGFSLLKISRKTHIRETVTSSSLLSYYTVSPDGMTVYFMQ